MPPKKGKGKKGGGKLKKKESEIPEVGKVYYDTRIAELNQILADLRTQIIIVEDRNKELIKEQNDLISDEIDIIAYLNKTIQDRSDEITNIQNDCNRVEAERIQEAQSYEEETERMKENHEMVEEQLLSDMKLTVGKMHSLEEFRLLRDELMQKYEVLENDEEEQKVRHKREIYEVERKFIIGEDKLKKEMDAKLKWLIEKFQAVTDLRVAATTLRVLKENIALNNMIESKLRNLRKLYGVHDKLESYDGKLQLMSQMTQFEARAMSKQSQLLRREIIDLVNEYFNMQKAIRAAKKLEPAIENYQRKIEEYSGKVAEYKTKSFILEQNLHELRCQREDYHANIRHELIRNEELKDMLRKVGSMLQSSDVNDDVFTLYGASPEEDRKTHSKSTVLYKIVEFLKQVRDWYRFPKPMEMLESRSDIYMQGSVGLVPREVILKSMIPTVKDQALQLDGSFDLIMSEGGDWECTDEEVEGETGQGIEEGEGGEGSVVMKIHAEEETQTEESLSEH